MCLLAALMAFAAAYAVLFLCTHGSMLPEKRTEYYEQKAKAEADSATGAEAELMALPAGLALVKKNRRIPCSLPPPCWPAV